MQAIVTKYLGPTNYRGARVKAMAQAGSVTIPWDDALDVDTNHEAAAVALCAKLKWTTENGHKGRWNGGGSPDGNGNVYVYTNSIGPGIKVL